MMKLAFLFALTLTAFAARAEEDFLSQPEDTSALEESADGGREPAAVAPMQNAAGKRAYPGGADEEDLRVLPALPEAALKTDARSVQREVYKNLYNQELKEQSQDAVEE